MALARLSRFVLACGTLFATLCLVGYAAGPEKASEPAVPRRVKVLFLGDSGHHVPLERCRQVFSTLARAGVDLTYTDRLDDLNPQNLSRFDALLVYANIERIGADQEKAILDYVAGGKGFVPIHCGSFCFLNSPQLTALTGARFKSHGTGVFKETIVNADHPVMKGLKPIESWDESYVHEMHNDKDRTVLSVREDEKGKEPYTWVRTHGKGRVFYTAWGHDQRTWGNENFVALLERGIRWASGDWALQPQPSLPAFTYSPANLPNYVPSARWGTMGEPIRTMQNPIPPAESMLHMVLPPGFNAKLFVSEPQVKKPICLAWDERGRLWVAETVDYPNDMQPRGKGNDQITICEDTDHDGVADKFTVFADKLSIPTSILPVNGGAIVTQAPDMLFLKDNDGDGKCDERKILFSGWGTADTHAEPSNLRYGFDNWIYGCVGYSGFDGVVGGKSMRFSSGAYRFKPDGSALEFLGSTNNNTWGLAFSEDNQLFLSTANDNPSDYLSIPNRYYETVPGLRGRGASLIFDTQKFFPTSEHVRQMDQHGRFTAASGHAIYTARAFPADYWNKVAFVTEPTGHLVAQFRLTPDGASFKSRNDFNLLSSDDDWTAPVAAEVGPDGAVWVIDWYNIIVQHNPIPVGYEKGKGNAYVTPLRDKRHGRVYRITWEGAKPYQPIDLAKASTEQLVDTLNSDNMFWRMSAQRMLVQGEHRDAVPALQKLIETKAASPESVIHALWTLRSLRGEGSELASDAQAALRVHGESAAVRRAVLDTMPRAADAGQGILKLLASETDPFVRKAALLALSELPPDATAGEAIFRLLDDSKVTADPILADAAAIAAARHDAGFLRAAFASYKLEGPVSTTPASGRNLLPNANFERGNGEKPAGWSSRSYGGAEAEYKWVDGGRNGGKCLQISSTGGSDAGWYAECPVEPNTDYRLSGWVKTKDVKNNGGRGAQFNTHNGAGQPRTRAIAGTQDWTRLEVTFNSGALERLGVNCLFGGWGNSTGTAWWDDVELVKVGSTTNLPGATGKVVRIVMNAYARRGDVKTVVPTVAALKTSQPELAAVVLDALAAGWPEGKAPELGDAEVKQLHEVMDALPAGVKGRLYVLAQRWGKADLFAGQRKAIIDELAAKLADAQQSQAARVAAAQKLVETDPGDGSVEAVLKQVNPQAGPALQVALIDALSGSVSPNVGTIVLGRWNTLTPSGQKSAIGVLLRNEAWSKSLVDAMEKGTVSNKDLQPEQWQALSNLGDPALVARIKKLRDATGRVASGDRKAMLDRLLPLAQKPGDVERGKAAFQKNCAVCHTLEGQGGKVGPDLTGIGARPRQDLLLDVLDPNRSVEGTYRAWLVKTKKEVLSGRLSNETQTSIELIDTTGKTYEISRDEILALKQSDLSVMPEGFESLPPEDLTSLLEYLATSRVKH